MSLEHESWTYCSKHSLEGPECRWQRLHTSAAVYLDTSYQSVYDRQAGWRTVKAVVPPCRMLSHRGGHISDQARPHFSFQECSGDNIDMQVTAAPAVKHASANGFQCRASPSRAACAFHKAAECVGVQTRLNGCSQVEQRQGEGLADRSAAPLSAGQLYAATPAAAVQPSAPLMGSVRGTAGAQSASAEDDTQGRSSTEDGQDPFQGELLPNGSVSRVESSKGKVAIEISERDGQQRNSSSPCDHVSHRGELTNGAGESHVIKRRDRQRPASGSAAQRGSIVINERAKRGADSCPEPPAKKSKCQEAFTLPDYGSSSSCSQDSASPNPEQSAQAKAELCSAEHMSAQNAHPPSKGDDVLIHSLGAPTTDSLGAGAAPGCTKASRLTTQEPLSAELEYSQSPVAVPSAAVRQPVTEDRGPAPAAPEQAHAPAMENVPLLSAASAAPAAELETAAALEDALEFPGADPEDAMASGDSSVCPAPGPLVNIEALSPAADAEADAAAAAAAAGQQHGSAAADECLQGSAHMGLAAHPRFAGDSSDAVPREPIVVALRSDGTQICVAGVRGSFLFMIRHLHG